MSAYDVFASAIAVVEEEKEIAENIRNYETRWYKGKYKVKIMLKSRMNYLVIACEEISDNILINDKFTTVPRLLWRHPRK